MRKIITLILFLFNLSFAQDYIPIKIDSLIYFNKSYETIKWTEKEVVEIDSIFRPKYYEGGVLIIPEKKKYITDTIYLSDVSGVSREKYHTVTTRYEHKYDRRILPYFSSNFCRPELDYFLNSNEPMLAWRAEVIPWNCYPTRFDFVLKEEYKNEYPNGLPQEIETFSYTISVAQFMKWEEWKLKEKHRTNQRIFGDFVYTDSEGNFYYPYPPGYYSNLEEIDCGKILMIKIQKALTARGYEVKTTGKVNAKMKAALVQFKKDNGLPSCGGDHILLRALLGKNY